MPTHGREERCVLTEFQKRSCVTHFSFALFPLPSYISSLPAQLQDHSAYLMFCTQETHFMFIYWLHPNTVQLDNMLFMCSGVNMHRGTASREAANNFISVCVNAALGEASSEEFAMAYHLLWM